MSLFDSMASGFGFGSSSSTRRKKKSDDSPFGGLKLNDTLASNINANGDDVTNMKSALKKVGFYKPPKFGITPYPDSDMFNGMTKYQKSRGLKPDGVAKPNGPTARSLGGELGVSSRDDNAAQVRRAQARREAERKEKEKQERDRQRQEERQLKLEREMEQKRQQDLQLQQKREMEQKRKQGALKPDDAPKSQPKPWYRTRKPEKISDEDYSSTRRTLEGMLRYGDNGDLPNLYADSIRNEGHKAANEMGEFMNQLEEAAPKRVKPFEKAVFNMLNDYQKETYFPEVFGKKKPELSKKTSIGGGEKVDLIALTQAKADKAASQDKSGKPAPLVTGLGKQESISLLNDSLKPPQVKRHAGEKQVAGIQALLPLLLGAPLVGAAGDYLGRQAEKLLRRKGNASPMDATPPPPPTPGLEPPEEPDTSKKETPAKPVAIPHTLGTPIPKDAPPTIYIHPMPPEDLRKLFERPEERRGNEETRKELERIRDWIISSHPEWKHIAGGRKKGAKEEKPEFWIPSRAKDFKGDGRRGGTFVDLTFKTPEGRLVHVQSVDVDKNGKPTQRELDAADRIRRDKGVDVYLIPKGMQMKR